MRTIDADEFVARMHKHVAGFDQDSREWLISVADVQRILLEVPTVEPKLGWISVNDRLPEMHHVVLAFSPHYNNIWALSLHEDGFWYYWMDVTRRYDPLWMGPITRWMPLPEPPKEDDDEP